MKRNRVYGLIILWCSWLILCYALADYFFRDIYYLEATTWREGGLVNEFNDELFYALILVGVAANLFYIALRILRK
jgi:hypothetical protein